MLLPSTALGNPSHPCQHPVASRPQQKPVLSSRSKVFAPTSPPGPAGLLGHCLNLPSRAGVGSRHLASQAGHTSWSGGVCSPEEGAVCKSVTGRTDPPPHSMYGVLWFVGGRKKESVCVVCGHMLGYPRNTCGRIHLKTNFSLACFCDGAVGSWGWGAFLSHVCCNQ